jgi:putative sterol carrier protein
VTHAFLSDDWMAAAREIREEYKDQVPAVTASIRINQVITDVPFGDGTVKAYIDTSGGEMAMELGELDSPDATVTVDYATAKALFVQQDQAAGMQAFMAGKIKVQGDMTKLMMMQAQPTNDAAKEVAEKIKAITAE